MKTPFLSFFLIFSAFVCSGQTSAQNSISNNIDGKERDQFAATSDFLDASINSLDSFLSLVRKENYRIKITSFNNPTSSDMGFNLENEIHIALKPLLAKTKSTNVNKFSQIVSTLLTTTSKAGASVTKTAIGSANPFLSTLFSLVGNLAISEKRITREDLDSFITNTSKYFVQYEKLNQANILFDYNIERISSRLKDLQFDIKEYMLDMIAIFYQKTQRNSLKTASLEDLLLKFLDKHKIEVLLVDASHNLESFLYPTDGIKSAKDISNNLQKIFDEYKKIFTDNYQQIRNILIESKSLGKNINIRQVDLSTKHLEELYNESKNSDILSLRLNTLFERLKILSATEQKK